MANHHLLGAGGETLAAQWLTKKGFVVLHMNWRHSYYEIDIIASCHDVLHFVEVKTRSNKKFGEPEESVDRKKIERLMKAGAEYHYLNPQWKRVQYDVLSIMMAAEKEADYFFIEDVYV